MSTKSSGEQIAAGAFKATYLRLMERVARDGISVTITKHGKPIARLVPVNVTEPPLFGSIPATIHGDIIGPFHEDWPEPTALEPE